MPRRAWRAVREALINLRSRRWLWLILALWLAGMLFPTALPGKSSPAYRAVFNAVFHPQWVHVVMHLVLFAGLSLLLVILFRLPLGWRTAGLLLGAAALVGVGQEILQAFSQGFLYIWGAAFDLGVDLLGAGLSYLLMWWRSLIRGARKSGLS